MADGKEEELRARPTFYVDGTPVIREEIKDDKKRGKDGLPS